MLSNLKFSNKNFFNFCKQLSSITTNIELFNNQDSEFIELKNNWPENEIKCFTKDMQIIPNFISEEEEQSFVTELEPYLKRMRYEFDHWDNAIHGFRETERKNWYPKNKDTINKIRDIAFQGEIMHYIHVLDLAENGVIKPHVDSTRYCGSTISGVSLLSDSVMRLVRTDENLYVQGKESSNEYRAKPIEKQQIDNKKQFYADILLKRRSLYIMKGTARYKFTHEILGNDISFFKNILIKRSRRISIICRNEP